MTQLPGLSFLVRGHQDRLGSETSCVHFPSHVVINAPSTWNATENTESAGTPSSFVKSSGDSDKQEQSNERWKGKFLIRTLKVPALS